MIWWTLLWATFFGIGFAQADGIMMAVSASFGLHALFDVARDIFRRGRA